MAPPSGTGLIHADGRPIKATDIARVRARASLAGGPGTGPNNWAYDAAVPVNSDMSGWLPYLRSPDSEINDDRDRMAARARDLVRNDGWAKGAINRILDAAVGAHFFPIPRPNWRALYRRYGSRFDLKWYEEFTTAVRSEWRSYANDVGNWADATCQQSVTQMLRTALRAKLIEGDAFANVLWDPDSVYAGGATYATRLELVDPDRVSNPLDMIDTHSRRGGVAIDNRGRPVGYYIRQAHQFDWYDAIASMTWDLFPRRTPQGRPVIVHDFDKDRAGQHRGVGILTEVLSRFRMLNRYDDASLKAAMLRAVLGFFVTSARDENDVSDSLSAQSGDSADDYFQNLANALYTQQPIMMNGARVPVMAPGEKVQSVTGGGQTDDYTAVQTAGHRNIAAATGQSAEEISNDFSHVNYSSFRGAMLQASRTMTRRQQDFAHGFATPFYGAWLEEVVDRFPELLPRGIDSDMFPEMRAALADCKWIGPGRGWVDPVKERQGEVLGLDAGFGTLEDTCADIEGEHWLDRLDQRAIEVQAMKERGLKLPDWAGSNPAAQVSQKPVAE